MNLSIQDKYLLSIIRVKWRSLQFLLLGFFLLPISVVQADDEAKKIKLITVKTLAELIVQEEHSVPANVISLNQPLLSSQISAKVKKINVDVGDNVKKGKVLIELDFRDYQNALQQAKASYLARKSQASFAEKTYNRNKKLVQQATLPQSALDQAESEYLSVRADLNALSVQQDSAELNVDRCLIKAPFTGQITKRQVQQGQLVSPNTALFELLQTSNLQISAELSGKQAQQIKRADKLFFRANGEDTAVRLHQIVSLIKETTRTQSARFYLPEKNNLVVGTAGRIIWKNNQPQLPARYVSQRKGKKGVLVVQEDKKTIKFISLENVQEGQAADINLPVDTLIVDSGRLTVQDKQVVKIK